MRGSTQASRAKTGNPGAVQVRGASSHGAPELREGPQCPYCQQPSLLLDGRTVYPHRADLHEKPFYVCRPCEAWVGCHPGTTTPLGRLADAALRRAKSSVHTKLDPYWKGAKNRKRMRARVYARLARELSIEGTECHVGMFDLERCEAALRCMAAWETLEEVHRCEI